MKSIYYIVACVFSVCMIAFSSCTEDEIVKTGTKGDGKTLFLKIGSIPKVVVDPMTKASKEDTEKVNDLCILIYNENGTLNQEDSRFIEGSGNELLQKLSETGEQTVTYSLSVTPGNKTCYLIANAGDVTDAAGFQTIERLAQCSFGSDLNGKNPQLVMFAEGGSFNVADSERCELSPALKRIYSMITVQVVKNLDSGYTVTPYKLELKNVPDRGFLFGNNRIGENGVGCSTLVTTVGGDAQEILNSEHSVAIPLFLYENMQGNGNNRTGKQSYKTPPTANQGIATKEYEKVKDDRTCPYIEVTAKYQGPNTIGSDDKITYRFFLGEDALNNFDVQRNYYYRITLNLPGNGGVDEASWRVEKDFMQDIEVEDVYVGYREGSETYIPVTGDTKTITNIRILSQDQVNGNNIFNIESSLDDVKRTGKTFLSVNFNNTHDFEQKKCTVQYTYGNNKTKTAIVHQVPRLVDPIAIFKGKDNADNYPVDVREYLYEGGKKGYYTLESKGPWSVQIKAASPTGWFKISVSDENGMKSTSTIGEKLAGTSSAVKFDYQPNGNGERHYGIILVKYHNEQCEHEIVVRQGYQETQLGNATWGMFNVTGIDNREDIQTTTYPTETGWLFRGGSNVGMHPFEPGWMVIDNGGESTKLAVSNSTQKKLFRETDFAESNRSWTKSPCPSGYSVASAPDFSSMADASYVNTGFVYDDDPEPGYTRDAQGRILEMDNTNHCNPAKGILFVAKNGAPVSVFFTFGKGVLTEHDGDGYIDEVGVGHRGIADRANGSGYFKNSALIYAENAYDHPENHKAYGAIYWTSTPGRGGSTHWAKADFSYNIFSKTVSIDGTGYSGLDARWHGNMIRCVRK